MRVIVAILLGMLVWACGSRKSEVLKQETEKKTETSRQAESSTQEAVAVNTEITADAVSWVIVPIDNTKPAQVTAPDGKTYKLDNAKLEVKKENTQAKVTTEAKKDNQLVIKAEVQEKERTAVKEKQTERKESFAWVIWLLIALLVLFLLWRLYKKSSFFS